jgi:hypothetical protein
MMTNSMKLHRPSAVPNEPLSLQSEGLRLGLFLYFLLFIGLLANEARAEDCRLSLSQPRIDYGVLRRTELLDEQVGRQKTSLGKRTLHLSVICADPRAVAIRFAGVPAGAQGFRFGRHGSFTLDLKHGQVDGRAVELSVEPSSVYADNGRLLPGQVLIARTGGMPATGRRFSAQVDIDTYLPPEAFSVRHETMFEGQGRFEWLPGG